MFKNLRSRINARWRTRVVEATQEKKNRASLAFTQPIIGARLVAGRGIFIDDPRTRF